MQCDNAPLLVEPVDEGRAMKPVEVPQSRPWVSAVSG